MLEKTVNKRRTNSSINNENQLKNKTINWWLLQGISEISGECYEEKQTIRLVNKQVLCIRQTEKKRLRTPSLMTITETLQKVLMNCALH